MERIIITIDGANAEIKAEALHQLIAQQIKESDITGTNVYIEQQIQVMPFAIRNQVERSGAYGEQVRSGLRYGRKG
ncbi:MAG: hypothetical protein OSJ72_19980 [Lachnospiraceae bacterium]|nr:hypothetical protein [Lachnospiraceae bacterium]